MLSKGLRTSTGLIMIEIDIKDSLAEGMEGYKLRWVATA